MSLLNSKQLLEMKQTLELHQTLTSNATTEKGQLHSVDTAYLFLLAALKWLLCQQEEEGDLGSISHSPVMREKYLHCLKYPIYMYHMNGFSVHQKEAIII